MSLTTTFYDSDLIPISNSYEQAQSLRSNLVWQKLNDITIEETIEHWLATLRPLTNRNYKSGMRKPIEKGLLNPLMTL